MTKYHAALRHFLLCTIYLNYVHIFIITCFKWKLIPRHLLFRTKLFKSFVSSKSKDQLYNPFVLCGVAKGNNGLACTSNGDASRDGWRRLTLAADMAKLVQWWGVILQIITVDENNDTKGKSTYVTRPITLAMLSKIEDKTINCTVLVVLTYFCSCFSRYRTGFK